LLIVLFAGVVALTREDGGEDDAAPVDLPAAVLDTEKDAVEEEPEPEWIPPSPPRWFRSNAGGMALEEIPSRLAALRNRYALVMDHINPDELEPFLKPFFDEDFDIQIRVLFEDGTESRRQWLFLDSAGTTRMNAVFRRPAAGMEDGFNDPGFMDGYEPEDLPEGGEDDFAYDGVGGGLDEEAEPAYSEERPAVEDPPIPDDFVAGEPVQTEEIGEIGEPDFTEAVAEVPDPPPPPRGEDTAPRHSSPVGFVEVFNEDGRISEDWLFAENGDTVITEFVYVGGFLVRAETKKRELDDPADGFLLLHTDHFRYNRSFSLRHVERVFSHPAGLEPVRLSFPVGILAAAFRGDFITAVTPGTDFMGTFENFFDAGDGLSVTSRTDSRGRILSQTMLDGDGDTVWEIVNTWDGDRIVSILRAEGDDERLTEFEFDADGNRIVQRETRNGIVERIVRTDGDTEIEELFMDGVLVMVARWEDGRRISEERVRRR